LLNTLYYSPFCQQSKRIKNKQKEEVKQENEYKMQLKRNFIKEYKHSTDKLEASLQDTKQRKTRCATKCWVEVVAVES